jgi:LemA protein
MSNEQWLVIGAVALLVFWMLGAHNRLVALRNQIGAAWTQFEAALQRRSSAIAPLLDALRAPMAEAQPLLDTVLKAQAEVQSAAERLRPRPAIAPAARELAAADAALSTALGELLGAIERQPALSEHAELAPHLQTLAEAAPRLDFARQLFNDAARDYNDAAQQFPTRWLTRLFGFGLAGEI